MKDGSGFSGTIVSVTGDSYGVDVAGKVLNIRKDSIASIEYAPDVEDRSSFFMRRGERIVKAGFGGALPLDAQGFSKIARPGFGSELEGLIQIDKNVGLGLRFDDAAFTVAYPQTRSLDGLATPQGLGFNQKTQVEVSSMLFEARNVVVPEKRVSPFFVLGTGFDVYTEQLQTTPKPNSGGWSDDGSYETRTTEDTSSGFAAELGAGIQVLISRRALAELAARWHYADVDNAKFGFTGAQTISLLAAFGWRF